MDSSKGERGRDQCACSVKSEKGNSTTDGECSCHRAGSGSWLLSYPNEDPCLHANWEIGLVLRDFCSCMGRPGPYKRLSRTTGLEIYNCDPALINLLRKGATSGTLRCDRTTLRMSSFAAESRAFGGVSYCKGFQGAVCAQSSAICTPSEKYPHIFHLSGLNHFAYK